MDVFERALNYLFYNEGGFSNDTNDHGGATRFGITRADASRWRHKPVSVQEMKEFPIEEAKEIYRRWYWQPVGCDKIVDPGIATAMFDIGVVRGISIPVRYAQMICNAKGSSLAVDEHIGPLTLASINSVGPAYFINAFALKAEKGFRAIAAQDTSQAVFLKGWVNRARRLMTLMPN